MDSLVLDAFATAFRFCCRVFAVQVVGIFTVQFLGFCLELRYGDDPMMELPKVQGDGTAI